MNSSFEKLDQEDSLKSFRELFHIPKISGKPAVYLSGNSLGLCPKKVSEVVQSEINDWANLGVEGHLKAHHPWYSYHERCLKPLASIVGGTTQEVIAMNSLTANLHFLFTSFYRPTAERHKVIILGEAFPSDRYAVESQILLHRGNPKDSLIEVGSEVLEAIEKEGKSTSIVFLENVHYLTGRAFDMKAITEAAHKRGCLVGWDLAHGVGNLELKLHDWNVDFAVWCSYKYLNAGPGAIGGAYIHERHVKDFKHLRLAGWWGHDKVKRFEFSKTFSPMASAEGWQVSNPPILQLAALMTSLDIFEKAGMANLRSKSERLTAYLESLLSDLPVTILTPRDPERRGCQISFELKKEKPDITEQFQKAGVICDVRNKTVVRVAPTPLYNSFEDVFLFSKALTEVLK